jgi:hypothetical protein
MQAYTVHEPPSPPADRIDRAERIVFVRDGFSLSAAIFAPLWLLAHRMWWPLLGYIVVVGGLEVAAGTWWNAGGGWVGLLVTALHLIVGFEADTLRRWQLDRRGWQNLGVVTGRNGEECERRFFDIWLPSKPIFAAPLPSGASATDGEPSPLRSAMRGLLGLRS